VTDQAPPSALDHYCRGCGHRLRPDIQFCTNCGNASAQSVGGAALTGDGKPPRDRSRSPRPGGSLVMRLAIVGGALAVVGLIVVIIVSVYPSGRSADSSGGSPRTGTTAPRDPGTTSPPPSSPPPSSAPASSAPASTSTTTVTEQQAATSLAALLARSASSRQAIDAAYSDALQCGPNPAQDAQTFQNAATGHQELMSDLARLPGRASLPQSMLNDLASAWQVSASADQDFAQWAQDQAQNGCAGGNQSDSGFVAATAPDLQATALKKAFIRLWDPLAESYGLATYQQNQF
jgi:hypothetical protein